MEPIRLLLEGGLLLGAVALSGILFRHLRLSSIPAFILLGLALRPVMGEAELVELFATLGVVLLLFFMGLEFSLQALLAQRTRIMSNGLRDLVVSFPVGFVAGLLLGWGLLGALLLGGAFYISSSAIIAKSIIELRRTAHPETEPVLGVLVFEDFAIAFLLALLSGIILAGGELIEGMFGALRALLFFSIVIAIARLGRRVVARLLDTEDDDLFILLAGSLVLILAWAALRAGLSEAIGAFLAGTLLAETEHKERLATLFSPLQGLFAALFFVSFGLSIELGTLPPVLVPALLLAVAAIATKLAAGWWIARAEGLSRRAAVSLGCTLIPRGEFSVVLAGLAATAGFAQAPPLIALVVLMLALTGTVAIRHAPALAERLFRSPPAPTLEERGFDPRLAAHDAPTPGGRADGSSVASQSFPTTEN